MSGHSKKKKQKRIAIPVPEQTPEPVSKKDFVILPDTKPALERRTILEDGLYALFKRNFPNYEDFMAVSWIRKYKPSMDLMVYGQKTGKMAEICDVYLLGEYVCEVIMTDTPAYALEKIKSGILELLRRKEEERRRKGGDV